MIPVSKEVATKIILDGIQKGFTVGYINKNKLYLKKNFKYDIKFWIY